MNSIDLNSLHKTIMTDFKNEIVYNENNKLEELYSSIDKKNVSLDVLNDLKKNSSKTLRIEDYHFYLLSAIPLLERYNSCKKSTKRISFFNSDKSQKQENHDQCNNVIKEYFNIVERFFGKENKYINTYNPKDDMIYDRKQHNKINASLNISCPTCENNKDFVVQSENLTICRVCGNNIENLNERYISFKDISRINLSSKYTYNRRSHFRDCIRRFQGKQTSTIPREVFVNITNELKNYKLIPMSYVYDPQKIEFDLFKNVNREHIMLIMKELSYNKYYEDITYIFHSLTNKPIPDISHLEPILLSDFDRLLNLYDQKHHDRKNFINNNYVLFQLLRKNGYKCNRNDFCHLKTNDRKYYHDVVCQELFQQLNWNFSPAF